MTTKAMRIVRLFPLFGEFLPYADQTYQCKIDDGIAILPRDGVSVTQT